MEKGRTYKDAGVDIELAKGLLSSLKGKLAEARRPEMLAPIGGFGGLFQLDLSKHKNPVLVSSIDGVGTKLMVAMMMNRFGTVGHDIVNHCVNDIAVQGAEPLFFMDYIGIGKLRSPLYEEVLSGIADACAAVGCGLLGGETAEMPGMYGDDFDLVGCITGVVEKDKIIDGKQNIRSGDVAIGLASNGLHTNGYSLARNIIFDKCKLSADSFLEELGESVGEALIKPHTCYWEAISKVLYDDGIPMSGIAHITGGGLCDNVPRILPDNVDVVFDTKIMPIPPIFTLLVREGSIAFEEAYRAFNMGIGMVWILHPSRASEAIDICQECGHDAAVIGEVLEGSGKVTIK